jgi:hypothetical protein
MRAMSTHPHGRSGGMAAFFRARGRGSPGPRPSTSQWRGDAPQVVAIANGHPQSTTTTALAVTNKAVTGRRAQRCGD